MMIRFSGMSLPTVSAPKKQATAARFEAPRFAGKRTVPFNLFKPSNPLTASVLENQRLTDPASPNDVRHIVIGTQGSGFQYVEGQCLGILPPGTDANGNPFKLRLYSISSPAKGDNGQGDSVSITVKRAPNGVASNYLADLKPGDTIKMTGPSGKQMLMPEDPNANMILIGTGTGVAPFRAFLKTRYGQNTQETGQTWLLFGVQSGKDLLYGQELASYGNQPGYHFVPALSREQTNSAGGKMYVQHRVTENADALLELIQKPNTYVYLCGLKGMESGIEDAFRKAAESKGLKWDDLQSQLKSENRWRVEVY